MVCLERQKKSINHCLPQNARFCSLSRFHVKLPQVRPEYNLLRLEFRPRIRVQEIRPRPPPPFNVVVLCSIGDLFSLENDVHRARNHWNEIEIDPLCFGQMAWKT